MGNTSDTSTPTQSTWSSEIFGAQDILAPNAATEPSKAEEVKAEEMPITIHLQEHRRPSS